MIFLSLLISGNIFSQEIIEQDGRRYVDTDYYNELVDEYNECRELLIECRNNTRETIQIVEKVIYEDKIIIEEVEKINTKRAWKNRLEGCFFGGGAVSLIFLILILI